MADDRTKLGPSDDQSPGAQQNQSYDQAPTPPTQPQVEEHPAEETIPPVPEDYRESLKIKPESKLNPTILVAAVALVLVVAGAAYFFTRGPVITTTSSIVTTLTSTNLIGISNCTVINTPGTYALSGNINASITSGACIKITSNNVKLLGNQNSVIGSGPFSIAPPYTYGIQLQNVSNVSVSGVRVLRFSYDVYVNNSHFYTLSNNNITRGTNAGLYISNSGNGTVNQNYISQSQSKQGGIYLRSGSKNKIINNTVLNNAFYGVVINSTGNNLTKNNYFSNPVDLVCNATSAFKYSNQFGISSCTLNNFCEFASCAKNIPFNLSTLKLNPGIVTTCGAIVAPGNYSLGQNLSTSRFINSSNPLSKSASCIRILSLNVKLNCNNYKISNSKYAVYFAGALNPNVTNCKFVNDTYGIYSNNTFNPQIKNVTVSKSTYGLYFTNTSSGRITNTNLVNNTYGIYMNASTGLLFSQTNAHMNSYGVYLNSGGSEVFSGGSVTNNIAPNQKGSDMYCSVSTYNSSSDLAQGFLCGVGSCTWARCNQTIPVTNITSYPISACGTISYPGNYSLKQNLISRGNCFNITSNNVNFNCNGHVILGGAGLPGSVFTILKHSNVSISNCKINQFGAAVNASNVKQLGLASFSINNTQQGIYLYNVSLANVINVSITAYSTNAFLLSKVRNSTITKNSGTNGANGASAFIFLNATNDQITFNNATTNPGYGFEFLNSRGNNVYNNTASANQQFDYFCSPSSGGLYAQKGNGVNFGFTKNKCSWLVELNYIATSPLCAAFATRTQLSMSTDLLYTAGNTCFTFYFTNATTGSSTSSANSSSINCNGHTILATSGGTFVNIINASSVKISNCILKNFTTPIISSAKYAFIQNLTITHANTSMLFTGVQFGTANRNTFSNSTYGIVVKRGGFETMNNDSFYNVTNPIRISNNTNSNVQNVTAINGGTGLLLANATLGSYKNDVLLNMSTVGFICSSSSIQANSNLDFGGNVCSKNSGCRWMSSSSSTCTPQ